jgi:putative transposase
MAATGAAETWFLPRHAHWVFVTTYRRGAPGTAMLEACETAIRKACRNFSADLRGFNGEDDHVHLLAGHPPKVAVFALVNSLKEVPARRLRSQYAGRVNRASVRNH